MLSDQGVDEVQPLHGFVGHKGSGGLLVCPDKLLKSRQDFSLHLAPDDLLFRGQRQLQLFRPVLCEEIALARAEVFQGYALLFDEVLDDRFDLQE